MPQKEKIIFVIAVLGFIILGWIWPDGTLTKYDVNRLGQLEYNVTENDDNPLTGVVPDENGKTVTRKDYALLEKFTEVTVEIPLYSTYEQAITEDSTYNYVDYHEYTNNNTGIDRIICGILEEGGAMAWIYTNCGTYTMYVESMTFNDKYHEEKLHSLLRDVSVDKSLADERYGSNL